MKVFTSLRRGIVALFLALLISPALASQPEKPPLAVNLAPVRDWSTQQPFLDVMKTARRWIGHRPGQWGGASYDEINAMGILDDRGWPRAIPRELGSIGTVILTDMPQEAMSLAGQYVLRFQGDGIVEVAGRARNVRYRGNEVRFDFTPGPGPVEIRIQRTDPGKTGDYVRNISVVRASRLAEFEAGAIFDPDWLAQLEGFEVLRFMDWMNTNDSDQRLWSNRPQETDFSYSRRGVPIEVMLELANVLGASAWVNMPHLADDDYVARFAMLVKQGLAPEMQIYVEYSNEVWNWQFLQAEWADAMGRELWGATYLGAQYYGMRAAEIARLWSGVYASQAEERLVNVISTQTGWLGLEADILTAPRMKSERGDAYQPPYDAFDAYAITGYFGHVLGTDKRVDLVNAWIVESLAVASADAAAAGLTGAAFDEYVGRHRFDLASERAFEELLNGQHSGDTQDTLQDLRDRVFPYHSEVAARYDLDLIMYEGGTHVVGIGAAVDNADFTAFFTTFNYSDQMGKLYDMVMQDWADAGGNLFNIFADVQAADKWGSWGALRYRDDANPRWDAIERWK